MPLEGHALLITMQTAHMLQYDLHMHYIDKGYDSLSMRASVLSTWHGVQSLSMHDTIPCCRLQATDMRLA